MFRRRGFTLIELVMVVIVLGVLSAIAIPRFVDVREDAHKAAVANTAAQLQSAVNLAHAACVTRQWGGKTDLPGYGDGDVDFFPNCYPSGAYYNITDSSSGMTNVRCIALFGAVLNSNYTIGHGPSYTNEDFQVTIAGSTGYCRLIYRRDGEGTRRLDYDWQNGVVVNIVNT